MIDYQLSCSVVLYNTDETLIRNLVDCLLKSSLGIKILLIDNSPEKTAAYDHLVSEKVDYIFNNSNLGYGAAHNIGIKKAIAAGIKYHLVLNPDIVFEAEVLTELLRFMDANHDIGHVMPKVFYPDGSVQYVCKLLPTPFDLIFKRFVPNNLFKKRFDRFQLKFTNYDQIMDVPYLSGCFMMLRVEVLEKSGLFDERFFMYPEDIDLTRRIHKVARTVFYPFVSVEHQHVGESYVSTKMLKIHIINMIKYFNKWGWVFDKERRKINSIILTKLHYNG
jgi:GT2 family glycosyltransferase